MKSQFQSPLRQCRRDSVQSVRERTNGFTSVKVCPSRVGDNESITADGRTPLQQVSLTVECRLDSGDICMYRDRNEPGFFECGSNLVRWFSLKPMGELNAVISACRNATNKIWKGIGMGLNTVQLKSDTR